MPKNKLLIPFIILLTANLIGGGYWLSRRINIADFIPSQTKIDFAKEFPEQPKANYYGWIGAERINMMIQYGSGDMFGGFYDNKINKRIGFSAGANTNDNGLTQGKPFILEMYLRDDSVNELKIGKILITSQIKDGEKTELNRGVKFLDSRVITGTYQPKDGLPEDVYLIQDQQKVENWTSKPLKGKVYKGKNTERPIYFIDMGSDNRQFFTFETWWFNEFKDGDEIIFDGKIREYNDVQKSGGIETNRGIFDIKSVRKI
jgi:hypothetical protein